MNGLDERNDDRMKSIAGDRLASPVLSLAAALARIMPGWLKRALYRFPPLARLIRRSLNRAAPQGWTTVEVAGGQLAGMWMILDLQNEKDYWLGTYEVDLQDALAELARPGMVAYDVGANIGYVTLLLAKAAGERGRVYAFEALPGNLERLRQNVALNGLEGRIFVQAAAVIDRAREVRFLVGPSGGMGKAEGSAGRTVEYPESIPVPGISLDEFVYEQGHPQPDLVKMDIEGGEVLALPGMERVLREARPVLLLELHGPEAARAAWDRLVAAGYRIARMAPGFPGVQSCQALDWKAYLVGLPL